MAGLWSKLTGTIPVPSAVAVVAILQRKCPFQSVSGNAQRQGLECGKEHFGGGARRVSLWTKRSNSGRAGAMKQKA
jgi:hypothetical protein